eukprot:7617678-Pyramimonas_sp.AAC.1
MVTAASAKVHYSFGNVMSCRDHYPLSIRFEWACEPFDVQIGRCPKMDPRRLASEAEQADYQARVAQAARI